MLCVEDLLSLELFRFLPPARLDWICERAQLCELNIGEVLIREGDPRAGSLFWSQDGQRLLGVVAALRCQLGSMRLPVFWVKFRF